jgi:hypothetical protein
VSDMLGAIFHYACSKPSSCTQNGWVSISHSLPNPTSRHPMASHLLHLLATQCSTLGSTRWHGASSKKAMR